MRAISKLSLWISIPIIFIITAVFYSILYLYSHFIIPSQSYVQLGTFVYDNNQEVKGIITVNLDSKKLLNDFSQIMQNPENPILVDSNGQLLVPPALLDMKTEHHRTSDQFAQHSPSEWKILSSSLPGINIFKYPLLLIAYLLTIMLTMLTIFYLVKSIAVKKHLRQTVLESEEQLKEITSTLDEIRLLAFHDPLTNLPNRRLLIERFTQALEEVKSEQHILATFLLDLDNFKQINDKFGHDVGDEVLKIIASRLDNCVRGEDILSRQGGDEFSLVLVRIARQEDAALVAEHILSTIRKPIITKCHTLSITASIGITLYNGSQRESIKQLLKNADIAMYQAKKEGGNRYCFYRLEYG